MKILFIHQSMPGQFKYLVEALCSRGDECYAITTRRPPECLPKKLKTFFYALSRGNGTNTHPLVVETEAKALRGEAVALIAEDLLKTGFTPDLIVAHPGWGEALFLKDIWKDVPQLHYVEFFYQLQDSDIDFRANSLDKQRWQDRAKCRMKNANTLLNISSMDWGLTPTRFQYNTLPEWAKLKTSIIHEGIDVDFAKPDAESSIQLNEHGRRLNGSDEVITFVNRTFEPYRGVDVFMRSLVKVMSARPRAQVLLIGSNTPKVSYGSMRTDGKGWITVLKEELGDQLDWSRIHMLGKIPHNQLIKCFQISSVHVYLSYPFVVSWSLLEAMSCGALIVGSATKPVEELIIHGKNGLTIPFFDVERLACTIIKVLEEPSKFKPLRDAARRTIVKDYERRDCIKRQIALLDAIANQAIAA